MKQIALKTFAVIALVATGFSAHADTVNMNTSATVVAPLATTVVSHLSFGRFASIPNMINTVVMSPDGVRVGSRLMASDTGTAGLLTVSGEPNAQFIVEGAPTQDLDDGSGNKMAVKYRTEVTGGGGAIDDDAGMALVSLDASGSASIKIGGDLVVPVAAPAGSYAATRTITVTYY